MLPQGGLKLMTKGNSGTTLIELVIALAVIGILCSSFLGIQLIFAKINRISRQHLTAGSIAGNLYELAKGMTISEFIDWTSADSILQDGFLFSIEAERYWPKTSPNNMDYIDLIVTQNSDNGFLCYSIGNSIDETHVFSGNGPLQIKLISDNTNTKLLLEDGEGNTASYSFDSVKADSVVNLHTHGISEGQEIIVLIEEQTNKNMKIYVYEPLLYNGCTKIQSEKQEVNTKELWQAYQHDNLLVTSRKSVTPEGIPIYLQVKAYEDIGGEWDSKPISRRQGVIICSNFLSKSSK